MISPGPSRFAYFRDPDWRRGLLRDGFGKGFWGFLAVAVVFGAICYAVKGHETFVETMAHDFALLMELLPRVILALSIAALIFYMLPRDRISGLVGSESGMLGLIVATIAGTITPGGPSSAYPLLAVLASSGADRGAMIAYITAWATLGVQRILVWDVPFMGTEFAILRFLVCLPLPIVAGLIARRLPFSLNVRQATPVKPEFSA